MTTSSTEAELLALSSAAKKEYALKRLFEEIELVIEEAWILICDNLQTLRLLTEETAKLTTRLRHVGFCTKSGNVTRVLITTLSDIGDLKT